MTSSSPQRRIATRVGSLAVADEGAGTPVVFWPSLFSDHRLFGHVCRLLGDGWRTLRIDGPGFGRSDPPRGDVQAGAYADAVVDVLDALGIDAAFVAGCSWGGQIAVQAGVRHPHRVRGVLAMNAPLEASRGGQPLEVLGTRWLGATEFWGWGVARAMLSAASRRAHPKRVREFAGAFPDFERRAAATTVRTVMSRFPGLGAVLPQLAVPATLLFGVEDRLCPWSGCGRSPGSRRWPRSRSFRSVDTSRRSRRLRPSSPCSRHSRHGRLPARRPDGSLRRVARSAHGCPPSARVSSTRCGISRGPSGTRAARS